MKGFKCRTQQYQGCFDDLEKDPDKVGGAEKWSLNCCFEEPLFDQYKSPSFGAESDCQEKEYVPDRFF